MSTFFILVVLTATTIAAIFLVFWLQDLPEFDEETQLSKKNGWDYLCLFFYVILVTVLNGSVGSVGEMIVERMNLGKDSE